MRRLLRPVAAGALLAAIAAGGCAGGANDATIARIGSASISKATYARWMASLAPQHAVPDPPGYSRCAARLGSIQAGIRAAVRRAECRREHRQLAQRALDALIADEWLIEAAAAQRTPVAGAEVQRRLQQREAASGGAAEYERSLRAIAHTTADVRLEIAAEIAAQKLRQRSLRSAARVTPAEVAAYYARHRREYAHPERRTFYIVENIRDLARAAAVRREVEHGANIAAISLHEILPRPADMRRARTIVKAIFGIRPGVVSQPVLVNGFAYFLVKVIHVAPARVEALAEATPSIRRILQREHDREALSAAVAGWRRAWTSKTDCRAGYVVQKCRQYHGPRGPEDPLAFS